MIIDIVYFCLPQKHIASGGIYYDRLKRSSVNPNCSYAFAYVCHTALFKYVGLGLRDRYWPGVAGIR